MDNRTIDVVSEGNEDLALALRIIWASAPGGKATHYKVLKLKEKVTYFNKPTTSHYTNLEESKGGVPTLVLLWHEEHGSQAFPFGIDVHLATDFVKGWLAQVDYGREPDHDGDNGKGWRVFTESWGHVAGHIYTVVAVQPAWAMYGK